MVQMNLKKKVFLFLEGNEKGWVYNKIPVHLQSQNDHKTTNNVHFHISL